MVFLEVCSEHFLLNALVVLHDEDLSFVSHEDPFVVPKAYQASDVWLKVNNLIVLSNAFWSNENVEHHHHLNGSPKCLSFVFGKKLDVYVSDIWVHHLVHERQYLRVESGLVGASLEGSAPAKLIPLFVIAVAFDFVHPFLSYFSVLKVHDLLKYCGVLHFTLPHFSENFRVLNKAVGLACTVLFKCISRQELHALQSIVLGASCVAIVDVRFRQRVHEECCFL